MEEGSEQAIIRNGGEWEHTTQPGGSRPPQEVHENRLGLVVGVMAHGDFVRTHLPGHPRQECVAHAPGRLLESQSVCASQRRYVLLLDGGWQAPFGGECCHEVGVGIGLCPARAVVQVGHV